MYNPLPLGYEVVVYKIHAQELSEFAIELQKKTGHKLTGFNASS